MPKIIEMSCFVRDSWPITVSPPCLGHPKTCTQKRESKFTPPFLGHFCNKTGGKTQFGIYIYISEISIKIIVANLEWTTSIRRRRRKGGGNNAHPQHPPKGLGVHRRGRVWAVRSNLVRVSERGAFSEGFLDRVLRWNSQKCLLGRT